MRSFKALGALLTYPNEDLIAALPEIREALAAEGVCDLSAIEPLLAHLGGGDLLDLQDAYVMQFDRTRSLSLHLYEHVWGEARERGQAMVRLQTVYGLHGFEAAEGELPDFLPLFCEFLSLVNEKAARVLLSDAAAVIETLRQRLARRGSPYAGVMAALVALAARAPDRAMLEQIAKGALPDDDSLEALDRAWEEEPVTFGPGDAARAAPAPNPSAAA